MEIQRIWKVKTNVIPVIIGKLERLKIIQKIPKQHTGEARNQGTTKKKQSYWSLHTLKSTKDLTLEIALYAPRRVTTE